MTIITDRINGAILAAPEPTRTSIATSFGRFSQTLDQIGNRPVTVSTPQISPGSAPQPRT